MNFRNITIDDTESVRHITLSSENPLNPISMEMIEEIGEALGEGGSRVVVISGRNKAFSAGANIKSFIDLNPERAYEFATRGHRIMDRIEHHPMPVIAAIHGYALGGGLELALACDLRIAHPQTKLGLPEINLGIIPGFGGTQRLLRLAGETRALQMITTGSTITAEKAMEFGILNEVTESYLQRSLELAIDLSKKPKNSLKFVKDLVRHIDQDYFELEREYFGRVFGLPDRKEGVQAFLEKREPSFGSN
jgi:enoyl-CoA hydratase/carnithine racemase